MIYIELFRIVYKFALGYQIEECVEIAQFRKLYSYMHPLSKVIPDSRHISISNYRSLVQISSDKSTHDDLHYHGLT